MNSNSESHSVCGFLFYYAGKATVNAFTCSPYNAIADSRDLFNGHNVQIVVSEVHEGTNDGKKLWFCTHEFTQRS